MRGVNLELQHGSTHALMGPNGSGKSTLGWSSLATLATKSPRVSFLSTVSICRKWRLTVEPRAGISMAFQRPVSVPGVKMADFVPRDYQRAAPTARKGKS
ncbi:MAG: ATP-binding cassette domain-containing protein [Pirellulaceae bacterium]